MNKEQEKALISEAFSSLREKAGPNIYIADLFDQNTESLILSTIDSDMVFPSFKEIQEERGKLEKENAALRKENGEMEKKIRNMENILKSLHREIAKARDRVLSLVDSVKSALAER